MVLPTRVESDEQTGLMEIVIIETKDKTKNPEINIVSESGEVVTVITTFQLLSSHIVVKEGDAVASGDVHCENT
jgi:DNA-directed RNA polymerase subunit beta'